MNDDVNFSGVEAVWNENSSYLTITDEMDPQQVPFLCGPENKQRSAC